MKYCPKCKKIEFSENKLCELGHKLKSDADPQQPAALLTANEINKGIIEETLIKAQIPYSVQQTSKVTPVMGVEDGSYIYYVPIGFVKKAIDALTGVSAMEIPDYYDKLDIPDEPVWEEMPPAKRRLVRALSVIGFIAVVYLCVAAVDFVAAFFVS